jgi:hypothetical protein
MKKLPNTEGGSEKKKSPAKKTPPRKKTAKANGMRKAISNAKDVKKVPTLKEELLSDHGNSLTVWKDGQDIMQEFNIKARTLHNWRKQKKIPYTKEGRKILYNRTLFEKLLLRKCVVGD